MLKKKVSKIKKDKLLKPKYNMFQNSCFMIKLAWTSKEKKVIALVLLSSVLAVILNLINLYVLPTILSAIERQVSFNSIVLLILAFTIGLMLVSALKSYVNTNTLFGRITVRMEIINLINRKASITSYPNVDDEKFRNLLSLSYQYTQSNYAATEAIWDTLAKLITNIIGFVIYICLLSTIKPLLMIITFFSAIIVYFVSVYLNGYGYRHRDEEAEYTKHMQYISKQAEDFSSAKDIRIFGLRPWLEELHTKAINAYIAFHKKAQGVYIWAKIIDLILAFLRNGIAYSYLIYLVINKGLSVSEFMLFFAAIGGFTEWIMGILNGLNTLHKQSLDITTVRECLEYNEPFKFDSGEHLNIDLNKQYEITLENVSFRYPGNDKDTLTNINLTLTYGEKLAVVGLNGAGKTTLVKLICGFLDPTEGRVLLNGKDIKDYNRADYYKMFSAVFQNFSILAGSIATNVSQSEVDIDTDRVEDCIKKAGLKDKIESLENGYNTNLNKEVYEDAISLSGGETQRLMLARALYKNAPIIVLDEPTAALDPIAESDLYQKYCEMTKGKSSIYISHRLASTRFCDRIILIDKAIICEEGKHEDLIKLDGKYAELYQIQSKYYQEGENGNEEK